MTKIALSLACATVTLAQACVLDRQVAARPESASLAQSDPIARAAVWQPRRIGSADLRLGPRGPEAFDPDELVRCTYVREDVGGSTPKFECRLPDGDEVKVKYGQDNGEVFAEVAATRLLWALGFGADRMYPVRVECRGCPEGGEIVGTGSQAVRRFEFAAIERKFPGREIDGPDGEGWAWSALDRIDPAAGPDALAHRDALKLLAVMLQHTDSKPEQQRLVCLDDEDDDQEDGDGEDRECRRPFLLMQDVGKTFGKANLLNRDAPGSVNLEAWAEAPVWKGADGCVGNLPQSFTGTLADPVITEAGRRFLASLLVQLSDRQLHDLFTVARFEDRALPGQSRTGSPEEWVRAFKQKVREVADRSCLAAGS